MRKPSVAGILACLFAMTAASCDRAEQTAQRTRSCPPLLLSLATIQLLGCVVDDNHLLEIGNPSPPAIPEDTPISFVAKLANAGPYCATVRAPTPIPPHLFVPIPGQPLFDNQAPCQAWREAPPVSKQ
jgi:hypothetical protein